MIRAALVLLGTAGYASAESVQAPAPVSVKVAASAKVRASDRLLSALRAEVGAAMQSEISGFLGSLGRSSFLERSKVIPVLGEQIKHGLFVTQALRSPRQATVNVVEQENAAAVESNAKYTA